MNLKKSSETRLTKTFKWKDRDGNLHEPRSMQTRHLFFTIRMIWNASCPEHLQLHPFQGYTFPMYYSKKYMIEGLQNLIPELATRDDMTPYMKKQLLKMIEWAGAMREHMEGGYLVSPEKEEEEPPALDKPEMEA